MNEHIGYMLAAALSAFDRQSPDLRLSSLSMSRIAMDPANSQEERDSAAGTLAELFDERPIHVQKFDLGDDQ